MSYLTDEQYHALELAISEDGLSSSATALELGISQPAASKYALLYGCPSPMREQDRLRGLNQRACRDCKETKAIDCFGFMDRKRGYRTSVCHKCVALRASKMKDNPSLDQRLAMLLGQAKHNAKARDREFLLTKDDLLGLWMAQGGLCAYSGVSMSLRQNNQALVTIDRVDSHKGYVSGNVVLCCLAVNIMKWDQSYDDLISWCTRIIQHHG